MKTKKKHSWLNKKQRLGIINHNTDKESMLKIRPRNEGGLIRVEKEVVREIDYFHKLNPEEQLLMELFIENFYNGKEVPGYKNPLSTKEIKKIATFKRHQKLDDLYSACIVNRDGKLERLDRYTNRMLKKKDK